MHQRIKDPIIFEYTGSSSYKNGDEVSTAGYEIGLKRNGDLVDLNFSYSFYKALDVDVADYETPDENMTLGQPQHKISASATFKFDREF